MKKDALQTTKYNYKDLGGTLIEKARESEVTNTEKLVVAGVRSIMSEITKLENRLKLQKARLEAIQAGEFVLERNYELDSPTIKFNDVELRGSL